jgi:hypothetical protein
LVSRPSKLKVALIADLILLAAIFPAYFYFDSQIVEPASFEVTDLVLDSDWIQLGESAQASATVTNLGDVTGNYTVTLLIDDIPVNTETVELSGGETTTVTFTAAELTEGNHTLSIDDVSQSLKVTSEQPDRPAELQLADLVTSRKEAGIGDPITVSVIASNVGDVAGEFTVDLYVNGQKRETKTVSLDGGKATSVDFEVSENAEGSYTVKIGELTASFTVTSDAQQVKPAEFQVTELTVTPSSVMGGDIVSVSVKVTNVGEEEGTYTVDLKVDGATIETQDVTVAGQASKFAEFEVSETTSGEHTVQVASLSESFTVVSYDAASSDVKLYRVVVSPYEVWEGDTVSISAQADNLVNEPSVLLVRLTVEDSVTDQIVVEQIESFDLAAGASEVPIDFTVTAGEGPEELGIRGYRVKLENLGTQSNSLSGYFNVATTDYHTLIINRAGGGSDPMIFELNGETLETPYREFLPVGEFYITTEEIVDVGTGVVQFYHWNDGVTDAARSFTLDKFTSLMAQYIVISGYASCPSLYTWNGTDYHYFTEVSNAGWLGYIDYITDNGTIVFGGGNPWDHVKIDKPQLQPKIDPETGEEYFDCVLFQQWDEIYYLDTAYLVVVDHPNDTDVYSTMINYVNRGFYGDVYTVDKDNLLIPVSAVNENGTDVLPLIAYLDGNFTPASNGVESPSWDDIKLNQLTLDLGDLSDAEEIKLVINGMVDWGPADPYYDWIDEFKAAAEQGLVENGTQLNPPAYMEVMDAQGNWVRVPQDRQMPIPGDYVPRTFAVDLNGLFPSDVTEYKIRITNFWNVTFDYIGVDTTAQQDITVTSILPSATLEPLEYAITNTNASGRFTAYGNVTELLLEADDKFVIGIQGDKVCLKFPTTGLPELEDGMERSYFMFVASWFKDHDGNWGYGFDFTVEPLPFRDMSGFPYPPTESHPDDSFLEEWNTRILNVP